MNPWVSAVRLLTAAWLVASGSVWATGDGLRIDPPRTLRTTPLVDHNGRTVSFPAIGTAWQLVVFGYTHCPDVCPMTLHKTSELLKDLGVDRQRVQVLFVSIDSTRDDVSVMRDFVQRFDSGITGLTGDAGSVQAVANEFEVLTRRFQGKTAMAYRLEHSSYIYLLDPEGKMRMLFPGSVRNDRLKAALEQVWRRPTATR